MKTILAVVEGQGDAAAVPGLVARVLHRLGRYDWTPGSTYEVGGLPGFRKHLGRYLGAVRRERVGGVLVLLDLDAAGSCPATEAQALAAEIRGAGLPVPVAVVFAYREYEAWLLASLETIAPDAADLPGDASFSGDPEGPRDCKAPISGLMPAGQTYSETAHQAEYTRRIDFDLAASRSRSFQRLLHAVEELTSGEVRVTPEP